MAVTFVATSATVTGANPTVAVPSGYAQGDLLFIITTGTATPTTPTGWTQSSAQGANSFITILYKFATGSESSVALTLAGTTSTAVMLAYRGASGINTVSGFTNNASATSLAPGLTGNTYANELEITIYAANNAVGTWGAAPSPTTGRVSSNPTATVNGLLIVDETQALAGNSTARTGTISTLHNLSAVAIAVIPSGRYWVGGTGTWDASTTTNWSFTSGGTGGAPAPTAVDNVFFDQSATYSVALSSAPLCFDMTVSAGVVTYSNTGALTVSGSMSLLTGTVWSGTGLLTFNSTSSGRTVTTNATTINGSITFNGVGGVWTLGSALTTGVTLTTTLTNGSLLLNGFNLTTGIFSSNNANTRTLTFGAGNIILSHTTAAQTVLDMAVVTGLTSTGTGGFTSDASVTRTYTFGTTGGSTANAPNLTLTGSGTAVGTFTTGSWFKTLSFGTTAFNPGITALNLNGLTLSSGGTFTTLTPTLLGTGTITSNTNTTLASLTINTTSGTTTLGDNFALSATSTVTLSSGTLALNGFNLTTGIFSSSVATTRAITFGSNNIVLAHTTAAQTVLNMATATGFTYTGTGGFTSDASVTRTYVFGTTGGSITNSPNLSLTGSGTQVGTFTTGSWFNTLNFGTTAFNPGTTTLNLNSLTLSSGGTFSTLTVTIVSTGTITSNANTTLGALTITAGTTTLGDNFALSATSTVTLTTGTLVLNGFNLTTGIFSSNNSNTRVITFGSNYIYLTHTTAATTVLNLGNVNLTWTGAGGFSTIMSVTRTFTAGGTPNNASGGANLFITSGSAAITLTSGAWFSILDFTGSTSTASLSLATNINVTSLILATGGTYTGLGVTTYNTGTITTNGKTIASFIAGSTAYTVLPTVTTLAGPVSCTRFDTALTGTHTIDFASYNLTSSGLFVYNIGTLSNIATITCTTFTVNQGSLTLTQGTITPSVSFTITGGGSFTYTGGTLSAVPTFTQTLGNVTLNQAYALTTAGTYTLVSGTLTLAANLSTGAFITTGTSTRAIGFGTSQITLTGNNTTIWDGGSTGITYTGTPTIVSNYTGSVGTRTINVGTAWTESTDFDVKVGSAVGISIGSSGTDTVAIAGVIASLDLTGMLFTFSPGVMTVYGSYTIPATGGSVSASANTTTFGSTQVTPVVITVSRSIDFPLTFNGTGGTFNLGANLTTGVTRLTTLTGGTLGLNGYNLTTGLFNSFTGSARTIAFGTNSITVNATGIQTVWDVGSATSLTYTGTPTVNVTSASGTTTIVNNSGGGNNTVNFNFPSGSSSVSFSLGVVNNIDFTGWTGAFTGALSVYGNFTLSSGMTTTSIGTMTFLATSGTKTITSNGKTISSVTINGIGGTFNLADPLNTGTGQLDIQGGTFNTNNNNVTCVYFWSYVSTSTRAINLGSSTITVSADFQVNTTGLTFNAGTSTIKAVGSQEFSLLVNNGSTTGLTFYNVDMSSVTPLATANPSAPLNTMTGKNTFNNLTLPTTTITGNSSAGYAITDNIVVNGIFTIPNSSIQRYFTLTSATLGSQVQITVNGTASIGNNVNFRDIYAAGSTIPWSGTNLGNIGNNTNITFAAGVNKYWSLAAGGNLNSTAWALTSGGTPSGANYPTPQDTIVIDNNGLNTGATINFNQDFYITNVNIASRTNAFTLTLSTAGMNVYVSGNWTNGSGLTSVSGTGGTINFSSSVSSTTQSITSAGKLFSPKINVNTTGTVQLADNFDQDSSVGLQTFTFTKGTITLNGFSLSTAIFSSTNSNIRTINFGSTYINLTHTTAATTVLDMTISTNFTASGEGGFRAAMTVTRTFVAGTGGVPTVPANLFIYSGASIPTFTTGSYFNLLDFTGSTSTPAVTALNLYSLTLATGGTYTNLTANMVGTGTVTGNSKTIVALNCLSGTTTLSTTLTAPTTVNGGTLTNPTGAILNAATFTLTTGTVNLNGGTLPTTATFGHTAGTLNVNSTTSLTATSTYTFTAGTLNLVNGTVLNVGIFSSNNSNTRSIAFGTTSSGNINLTHTTAATTVLSMATLTGFTYTGLGGFTVATMGNTRTFTCGSTAGGTSTNAPNLTFTSGASVATITSASWFNKLDYGTTSFTQAASTLNVNSITLSTGGTYTALILNIQGTGTLTYNGKTTAAVTLLAGTTTLADTLTCTTFTINGPDFALSSGTLTPSTSFVVTSGSFTYSGTATLGSVPTFTQTAGNVTFSKSYSLTATGTYTHTAGNLTLGSGVILSTGIFSSNNANTRSIAFGAAILTPSGSIFFNGTSQYLSRTGTTGDGLDLATGASDWTVECWFQPTGAAATGSIFWKGGTTGSVNPSYALFLSAGAGQWIVGDGAGGGYVQNISGTFLVNTWYHFALVRNGSTLTAYINGVAQTPLTITTAIGNTSNNTITIGSSVADGSTRFLAGYISNFRIVKGTAVYTSNFTPSTIPLGATQSSNLYGSPSAAITGTQTSLLLNTVFGQNYTQDSSSYALAITNVASSVSRTLTPWSGSINLTHTTAATVVLSMATLTGASYTGTGGFTVADMGVTRTFTVGTTAGGSTTTAPNLAFTTGASIPTITTGGWYDNLEFGAISSTLAATAQSITGSLNLSPAGTYTALTPSLVSTDTGLLFSNGKTVAALIINGTGGTFSFIDATTITGALTLTAGSVIAYANISSATFASTGTVTRSLTGPNITYTVSGAGATAFSNASGTGMSMTNIIISMTNAAAKTFAGGGGSYPTLNQGGAGALTISGSNSFENITNTTRPATVTFTSGTTQTFQNFSLAGIAGSLLTINASTAASAATLSKASGPVYGSYLSIQDSTATGGATWYAGPTSTNVSNNTGWIFSQLNIVTLGPLTMDTSLGGLTISNDPIPV